METCNSAYCSICMWNMKHDSWKWKKTCKKSLKDILCDLFFVWINRSPSDSCISNVGLMTIEGYSDKVKLLFLGRLCRTASHTLHKQLFNLRVGQITSLTLDYIKTNLDKYDMTVFLENYLLDGFLWVFFTNLYGAK